MKTKPIAILSRRPSTTLGAQLTALLWLTLALPAVATSLQLNFTVPSSFNESNRQALLEWTAAPARTYLVQSATNLAPDADWKTEEAVRSSTNGPIKWMAPEVLSAQKFYRLILPQPEVFSVEPAFVNSEEPGALFYLIGQLLPTNGSVVINGQYFSITSFDPNGSWVAVSLNGLPPGTPVFGNILVLNNASNIVTTVPIQNPVYYGTEPTTEQLQGPPEDPPASPTALISIWASKKGYEYYKNMSDFASAGGGGGGAGGLFGFPEPEQAQGKSTPVTRSNISNNRSAGLGAGAIGGITGGVIAGRYEVAGGTGEFQVEETDLAIPGRGLDFAWTRTYRSRTGPSTAQGAGWDFSFNVSLTQNGDGTVTLRPGNGRADTFYPDGTNGWSRDEYFCQVVDLNGDGFPDVLFADTGRWLFNPLGTAAGGKLSQIIDRNGNSISLGYNFKGQLETIVDDLGRTNFVAYNGGGRLASVTDFSGRTVRYEYDGNGDLVACVSPAVVGTPNGNDFPGGKTNRYAYTSGNLDDRLNHNLAAHTAPNGQNWLTVIYQATNDPASIDFDNVATLLRGIDKKDIRRARVVAQPSNSFATVQTFINDFVGNVTEGRFDSRHRTVSVREFTGRANPALPTTATENRPTGKLRAADPDYFETRWEWNADSLCTREVRPDGGSTEVTYQRAFNQNSSRSNNAKAALHNGDARVMRERASSAVDSDGDGVPDTSELAWHFEHDPRFGSPERLSGPGQCHWGNARLRSGVIAEVGAGRPATVGRERAANPDSGGDQTVAEAGAFGRKKLKATTGTKGDFNLANRFSFEIDGFVISATDPRGNVTLADFDDHGNCMRLRKRPELLYQEWDGVLAAFGYNASGQLTDITYAPAASGRYYWERHIFSDDPFTSRSAPLAIIADADGLRLTNRFEYDGRDNLTRVVDPRGNDQLFTYNALDQLVTAQSQPTSSGERIQTVFHYDANDNLVQADLDNRDETGALIAANPQWTTRLEHDALDRLTGIVEEISEGGGLPGSYVTNRFVYDANDNLIELRSPLAVAGIDPNNKVAIAYDERDLLFREIAAPGSPVQSTAQCDYDVNGNLIRVSEGLEGTPSVTTIEYDGFAMRSNQPIVTKDVDNFSASRLKVWQLMQGQSGTQAMRSNQPIVTKDVDNFTASAERWTPLVPKPRDPVTYRLKVWQLMQGQNSSAAMRVSKTTDPLGNVTTFHYDANDNLKVARHFGETNDVPGSIGNRLLAETRFSYDSLDRCVQQVDSFFDIFTELSIGDGRATTTYSYAPNGDCKSITDDNGHATRFAYDTAGRLSSITDAKTNVLSFTYDEASNVLSVTRTDRSDLTPGAQQFSAVHAYDKLHRLTRSVDNVGNTNRYAYDSRDNLVHETDPRGNDSFYRYDGLARVVDVASYVGPCDAAGNGITINTSHVEYDINSRLIGVTDSNGNPTAYAYDSLDRPVTIVRADNTRTKLVWSPRSNLISVEVANGTTITNTYNLRNYIIHRDLATRNGVQATTTFEDFAYDGAGNLVLAANDASTSTFAYDSLGHPVRTTQDGFTTTTTFDAIGNPLSQSYPGGRVVTYTYDALDQVASVSSAASGLPPTVLTQYAYEGPGRLGRITRANGVSTRLQWNGLVNPPNASGDFGWGQVKGVNHQVAGGGAVIDQRRATYDPAQNKTLRAQILPFYPGGDMTTNVFEYDPLDRLSRAINTKGTGATVRLYALDGNGNRQVVTSNGIPAPYTMDATIPPGDFQVNQYTGTPFGSQEFDENGNLISRVSPAGPTFYLYDYADRLVQVTGLTGGGFLEPIVSFSYDALGRCISKTIYSGVPAVPVTTYYIFAVVEYKDGEDHVTHTRPGNHKPGKLRVIEERVGSSVTREYCDLTAFTASGQPQYYHCDELGNVLAITDAAGAVIERYEYDEFGAVTFLTSEGMPTGATSSAVGNPYLLGGRRYDAETGLHHDEGGSYYDPLTGRDISNPESSYSTRAGISTSRSNIRDKSRLLDDRGGGGGGGGVFSKVPRNILKSFFQTGDKPTQGQFRSTSSPGGGHARGRDKNMTDVVSKKI